MTTVDDSPFSGWPRSEDRTLQPFLPPRGGHARGAPDHRPETTPDEEPPLNPSTLLRRHNEGDWFIAVKANVDLVVTTLADEWAGIRHLGVESKPVVVKEPMAAFVQREDSPWTIGFMGNEKWELLKKQVLTVEVSRLLGAEVLSLSKWEDVQVCYANRGVMQQCFDAFIYCDAADSDWDGVDGLDDGLIDEYCAQLGIVFPDMVAQVLKSNPRADEGYLSVWVPPSFAVRPIRVGALSYERGAGPGDPKWQSMPRPLLALRAQGPALADLHRQLRRKASPGPG